MGFFYLLICISFQFKLNKNIIGEWEIYDDYKSKKSLYYIEFHKDNGIIVGSIWNNTNTPSKTVQDPDDFVLTFFEIFFETDSKGTFKYGKKSVDFNFQTTSQQLFSTGLFDGGKYSITFSDEKNAEIIFDFNGIKTNLKAQKREEIPVQRNMKKLFFISYIVSMTFIFLFTVKTFCFGKQSPPPNADQRTKANANTKEETHEKLHKD